MHCNHFMMNSITIRNLAPEVKAKLRIRAARRGLSMEQEIRDILRKAVAEEAETPRNLAHAIRELFRPFGGVELELPQRDPMRRPPDLR